MLSKFNGTSTPKGSYRAKRGDNDCNVNSSRYRLSTALCESIRYQAKSEQDVQQDLILRVRHGKAALCTPTETFTGNIVGYMVNCESIIYTLIPKHPWILEICFNIIELNHRAEKSLVNNKHAVLFTWLLNDKMVDNRTDGNADPIVKSGDTPLTLNVLLQAYKSKDFQDVLISAITPIFEQQNKRVETLETELITGA